MSDNEIIARFDDWTYEMTTKRSRSDLFDNPRMRWVSPDSNEARDTPLPYDADIALWHGPGGLLQKIEEKWLRGWFQMQMHTIFCSACFDDELWDCMTATPAQLSAALVATIKEGH